MLERQLHKRFKKYRHHGEWFEFSEEIQAYAKANLEIDDSLNEISRNVILINTKEI
jgi:hypothetical protein